MYEQQQEREQEEQAAATGGSSSRHCVNLAMMVLSYSFPWSCYMILRGLVHEDDGYLLKLVLTTQQQQCQYHQTHVRSTHLPQFQSPRGPPERDPPPPEYSGLPPTKFSQITGTSKYLLIPKIVRTALRVGFTEQSAHFLWGLWLMVPSLGFREGTL